MRNSQPIGIFDSGIGGTSIWREINLLLPNENTIYLADSANAPYGKQSPKKILELSIKNTEYLIGKGCKVIVVACNTATTNAIKSLRKSYDLPFVGIEPAIKPAALNTQSNRVGILATKGTLSSSLFAETSDKFASNIQIMEQVGTGIVELIENGKLHSKEMTQLLESYLTPMREKKIDYLVLGCSHYPYLTTQIQHILGKGVKIIDSGFAVAKQAKSILIKSDFLSKSTSKGTHEFYSNVKDISTLKSIIGKLDSNYNISSLKF